MPDSGCSNTATAAAVKQPRPHLPCIFPDFQAKTSAPVWTQMGVRASRMLLVSDDS